jgi:Divergent InlB B-repeat domain
MATPAKNQCLEGFTGALSGTTDPQNLTISAPATVGAKFFPIQPTTIVGSPDQFAEFIADGVTYKQETGFYWAPGSKHNVTFPSPQPSGNTGERLVFSKWSDGVTSNPRVFTATAKGGTYEADMTTQELVTVTISPLSAGTVTGAGWIDQSTTTTLTATPVGGVVFDSYSGSVNTTTNPDTITVHKAMNITANFTALPPTVVASVSNVTPLSPTQVEMTLALTDASTGAALNLSVNALTVAGVIGPGPVTVASPVPIAYGSLSPGQTSTGTVLFNWPAPFVGTSAIQLLVQFTANGGVYTGSQVLLVTR